MSSDALQKFYSLFQVLQQKRMARTCWGFLQLFLCSSIFYWTIESYNKFYREAISLEIEFNLKMITGGAEWLNHTQRMHCWMSFYPFFQWILQTENFKSTTTRLGLYRKWSLKWTGVETKTPVINGCAFIDWPEVEPLITSSFNGMQALNKLKRNAPIASSIDWRTHLKYYLKQFSVDCTLISSLIASRMN